MSKLVVGISCFYHDSAASLLKDGEILAASQEERFTRKKNDSRFPKNAIIYCLKSQGLDLRNIDAVIYYEKPLLTFERLLETYLAQHQGDTFIYFRNASVVKGKLFKSRN